ncbi:hypothetical protein ES705_16760 [subsurface metagenome]|jgi:hypothetical protein
MKLYSGKKTNVGPNDIYVFEDGKKTLLDPKPSQDIYNHSSDGFNWGYIGPGPSHAALGILLDCVGKDLAVLFYNLFMFDFVAGWKNVFSISDKRINRYIKNFSGK